MISLTVLKTSSFLGSKGRVFVKASLKQTEQIGKRTAQLEFLPSPSPPVLNGQQATHPRNATGRMLTSPLILVQFLKESMFVAFMERIPLSSPIPMPLHTVKRDIQKSGGRRVKLSHLEGNRHRDAISPESTPILSNLSL